MHRMPLRQQARKDGERCTKPIAQRHRTALAAVDEPSKQHWIVSELEKLSIWPNQEESLG